MLNIIYGPDSADKDIYIKNKIGSAAGSVWILVPDAILRLSNAKARILLRLG